MEYYLAIDIGASSGRLILSHLEDNIIKSEVVHRFEHKIIQKDKHLIWDIENIFENIFEGLKICKDLGKAPKTLGIDTFGVDYCLIDDENNIIGDVYSYRDTRTVVSKKQFHEHISKENYFKETGVQPQPYNTIYQLMSDRLSGKLEHAKKIIMLPSYLNYVLTGKLANERTILSTSGLLDKSGTDYHAKTLEILGLREEQFPPIVDAGIILGKVKPSIARKIGYSPQVVVVCQHDTASAVMGSLSDESVIFLSSGTWSLLGIQTYEKYTDQSSYKLGFTNEIGYGSINRFLKNIMGLWIVQRLRDENNKDLSFEEISKQASKNSNYQVTFDVNDESFLSPKSMTKAIYDYMDEHKLARPNNIWELYYAVYNSLAKEYAKTVYDIECIIGSNFESINIFGGGSENKLLNELTQKYTHKKITSGPKEATALGNVIVQIIKDGKLETNGGFKKQFIRNSIKVENGE